jgi:glycosyltransferase involved in cell wall biosynthesis
VKRLIYLTRQPFWWQAAGTWARALSLVRYLDERHRVRVVFTGSRRALHDDLRRRGLVVIPELDRDPAAARAALARFFAEAAVDACLFGDISLYPLLEVVPCGVKLFLDTNDVVHEQAESFRRLGLTPPQELSEAAEFEIFRRFDVVLAIQEREQASVARAVGPERALCVPHPPPLKRRELREVPRSVGFVASAWVANREALSWLASEIWPRVERPEVRLDVYGGISRVHREPVASWMKLHGATPSLDSIYDSIDVSVNPVRCGAGLKIKSVEALGAGIPLVTTSEGARGLERGAGRAFLVADSAEEFAAALRRVIDDRALREQLSRDGHAFAEQELSPDVCFGPLLRAIESPRRYVALSSSPG